MACRLAHLLLSCVCAASYPALEPLARAQTPSAYGPGLSGAAVGASGAAGVAASSQSAQPGAHSLAVPGAVSNTLSLTSSTGTQMQNLLQAQVASMKRSPSALNPPATLPTVKRASSQRTAIDQYSYRVLY